MFYVLGFLDCGCYFVVLSLFLTRGPVGLTRIASLKTKVCDSADQVVFTIY